MFAEPDPLSSVGLWSGLLVVLGGVSAVGIFLKVHTVLYIHTCVLISFGLLFQIHYVDFLFHCGW